MVRILLLVVLCVSVQGFAQTKDSYKLIVSGAGPGGLMTALGAVQAGYNPKDILVIEKRPRQGEGSHGSRKRMLTIDSTTTRILDAFNLSDTYVPIVDLVNVGRNGGFGYLPFSGITTKVSNIIFGDRDVVAMASVGEMEKAMLRSLLNAGVEVKFDVNGKIKPSREKSNGFNIHIDGRKINAEEIVVAQGARGSFSKVLPKYMVDEKGTSEFMTMDVPLTKRDFLRTGDMIVHTHPSGVSVYGFVGKSSVSFGVILPPGHSVRQMKEGSALRNQWDTILMQMAFDMGFKAPPSKINIDIYRGEASYLESARVGNVTIIGESARTVDALSGTGANAAIRDAMAMVGYFTGEIGLSGLVDVLRGHTRWAMEYSLFFREVVAATLSRPELQNLSNLAFLPVRGTGTRSLVNAMDSVFELSTWWMGSAQKKKLSASVLGIEPAFSSEWREGAIGFPHPTDSISVDEYWELKGNKSIVRMCKSLFN